MSRQVGDAPAMCLTGVRVIELASLYAAPLIGTTLGDFGADVVKVEHPRGDDARRWGLSKDGVPLWWKSISRNKQLIQLDLNTEEGRETALRLIDDADVVIENFRPGRMEQWSMGYEELSRRNPKLVMVRVSGFGQTGPYRDRPGFGTLAEAFSGFAHMTGLKDGPPTLPPFGLADGVAGITGTYAVLAALYWRDAQRGGVGQMIDLSLYEPLFSILGPQIMEYDALGVVQQRNGNRSPRTTPRNAYETADGRWVAMSGGTQQIANRIFEAIGRPEMTTDPRFATPPARREHSATVDEVVAEWVAAHPLEEVLRCFEAAQAPIAAVMDTAQIFTNEQYRERPSLLTLPDEDLGELTMPNIPVRLSRTPAVVRHTGRTEIGADESAVLGTLAEPASTAEAVEPAESAVDAPPWADLLSDEDRSRVQRAGFGRRVGFGERVAVLVIDTQNYMLGPVPGSSAEYPAACGPVAERAVEKLQELLRVARASGAFVAYTRFELRRDGRDSGAYLLKRGLPDTEGWALEGSKGAEIIPALAPAPDDMVFVKKKPSGFHGTPLLGYLVDRGIDTVIVTGGSTSNCVRATAVDAASYNFRTIIASDCVFDRFDVSHRVALFDLDRQYGDVMPSAEIIQTLEKAAVR